MYDNCGSLKQIYLTADKKWISRIFDPIGPVGRPDTWTSLILTKNVFFELEALYPHVDVQFELVQWVHNYRQNW